MGRKMWVRISFFGKGGWPIRPIEIQPCCMKLSYGRLVLYLRDFGEKKEIANEK